MPVSDTASITKKIPAIQRDTGISVTLAVALHAALIATVLFWQPPANTAVNRSPVILLSVAPPIHHTEATSINQPKASTAAPVPPKPKLSPPTEVNKPPVPSAVLPNPPPVIHAPVNTDISPTPSTVLQTPVNNTPALVAAPTTTNTPAVQQTSPASTASTSNNSTETVAPSAVKTPVISVIFNAGYLNNPAPVYPNISRLRGETGKVLLRVAVNREGRASSVELHRSSGSQKLDEAAIRVVSTWNFVPAKVDGMPINSTVIVPIDFQLD